MYFVVRDCLCKFFFQELHRTVEGFYRWPILKRKFKLHVGMVKRSNKFKTTYATRTKKNIIKWLIQYQLKVFTSTVNLFSKVYKTITVPYCITASYFGLKNTLKSIWTHKILYIFMKHNLLYNVKLFCRTAHWWHTMPPLYIWILKVHD